MVNSTKGKSVTVISKDDPFMFRKTVRKENLLITENVVVTEKNNIDFESVAPGAILYIQFPKLLL